MKINLKYIFNVLLLVGIFWLTYRLMFAGEELSEIIRDMQDASPNWILAGAVLSMAFVSGEACSIYYMLRVMKQKRSFLSCMKYAFVGFFFSYITPSSSGGQPAQMYFMKKDGVKLGFSAVIMLLITIAYKSVLVILGGGFLLWKHGIVREEASRIEWLIALGFVLNIAFIGVFVLFLKKPEFMRSAGSKLIRFLSDKRLLKAKKSERYFAKINRICDNFNLGSNYMRQNHRSLLTVFAITALERMCLFTITWAVYRSYGLSGTGFSDIIALQVLIGVAVEMLPLPGAAGISEGCFLLVFEQIFTAALVKPALLLTRGLSFYLVLAVGGVVTLAAHLMNLRSEKHISKKKRRAD